MKTWTGCNRDLFSSLSFPAASWLSSLWNDETLWYAKERGIFKPRASQHWVSNFVLFRRRRVQRNIYCLWMLPSDLCLAHKSTSQREKDSSFYYIRQPSLDSWRCCVQKCALWVSEFRLSKYDINHIWATSPNLSKMHWRSLQSKFISHIREKKWKKRKADRSIPITSH